MSYNNINHYYYFLYFHAYFVSHILIALYVCKRICGAEKIIYVPISKD